MHLLIYMKLFRFTFLIGCLGINLLIVAQAKIITQLIPYEHDGVKLEGVLAYDDSLVGNAKLPGVLILPEWWGINDYVKERAHKVAALGYIAFVADMYGAGVSTTNAKEAGALSGPFYGKPLMAERAEAGLSQLTKSEYVDTSRIAAIGYCFGGTAAQVLSYSGAPLVGIVSFHGGLAPVPADAVTKNKAKILICHGAIDPFVKKADIDSFQKSMNDGKFDYQFISYSGAVHAFSNPGATELARVNGLSGNIAYNEPADRHSWEHMKLFLNEVFAKSSR
jgi:dienelactone hydrolase